MKSSAALRTALQQLDRKSYPGYKSLAGQYQFSQYVLSIDHVQGDPFAAPSKVSIRIKGQMAGFPADLYEQRCKRIALQDFLIRKLAGPIGAHSFKAKGSGKSGLLSISQPGAEVIERTACGIDDRSGDVIVGLEIGFPANGRTINARELDKILFSFLPKCIADSLFYQVLDHKKLTAAINLAVDQDSIRKQLPALGLIAFVANGSILPRVSGVSQQPMTNAIAFVSPPSLAVSIQVPHAGTITGMGIKKGISLIIGGGYHGKSTLLKALELGVYNHQGGDGREFVITDDSAMKIRAEDGRSIKQVDISMFIQNLPNKKDTTAFDTPDASGSTSQAANVVEAMEAGATVLLIDEDTSATNFMVRDELMQKVVHPSEEPITPFIERIGQLYEEQGISSIIVAGSSGSYFHPADVIVQMDNYIPREVTEQAKKAALDYPMTAALKRPFNAPAYNRSPKPSQQLKRDSRVKIKTMGKDQLQINKSTIDLHSVEQLVDVEQTNTLGYLLLYAQAKLCNTGATMQQVVAQLLEEIEKQGLSAITQSSTYHSSLALPRQQEIFACFNRYRELKL